jgi:thioredoxin-related protein
MLVALCLVATCGRLGRDYDPSRDAEQDLRRAVEQAQSSGRRILLIVGGEWCSWCKTLDRFIKNTPEVAVIWNGQFITVHVNVSPENENTAFLSQFPEISEYPHILVLDKDGHLLHSQGTSQFESGGSYSTQRVMAFLEAWTPKK